jgi:tRNA (cytidine/uridine-2'-O-)-methyltransferase
MNSVEYSYQSGDWLLFGSETDGIPADLLNQCDDTVYIPMAEPGVRSLNLSVSVAIGLFEARRQLGFIR